MISVKIIRWDKPIPLESGKMADIKCVLADDEEAERYARDMADKYGRKVVVII